MVRFLIALVVLGGCAEVTRSPLFGGDGGDSDAQADDAHTDVITTTDAAVSTDSATLDAGNDAASTQDADDNSGSDASLDAGSDAGGGGEDAGADAQTGSGGFGGTGGDSGTGGTDGVEDAGTDARALDDAGRDAGGCTPITLYRDADRDGFGDPNDSVATCGAPFGYVIRGTDCYDGNNLAKPGVTSSYEEDRGDGSFDYDCDGVETPMWTAMSPCRGADGVGGAAGWRDVCLQPVMGGCNEYRGVPDCGVTGYWISETGVCPARGLDRRQRCR